MVEDISPVDFKGKGIINRVAILFYDKKKPRVFTGTLLEKNITETQVVIEDFLELLYIDDNYKIDIDPDIHYKNLINGLRKNDVVKVCKQRKLQKRSFAKSKIFYSNICPAEILQFIQKMINKK